MRKAGNKSSFIFFQQQDDEFLKTKFSQNTEKRNTIKISLRNISKNGIYQTTFDRFRSILQ